MSFMDVLRVLKKAVKASLRTRALELVWDLERHKFADTPKGKEAFNQWIETQNLNPLNWSLSECYQFIIQVKKQKDDSFNQTTPDTLATDGTKSQAV